METILDSLAGPQTQTFGYDSLNRLTSAVATGGSNGLYNESYTYNANTGNLSSKAGITYTYDSAHPHAVGSLSNGYSYLYDANGNMIERDLGALEFDLAYDAENRLVTVTGNGLAPTATAAPSQTPPPTATATKTSTPSLTPTATVTPTGPTATPSATQTPSPTNTPGGPTPTFTPTASSTATSSSSDLIFADGFESGDLSAWTSSTTDGGDLSASSAAATNGSFGMQAVIDDNTVLYVNDDTPNAELRYRARFYFDPNSITMASGDTHYLFRGLQGTSTEVLRVQFRFSSGNYQVRAGLVDDGSTLTETSWFTISDAAHYIEWDWRAASASGANDGGLTLWIDGTQQENLTGIDNDTRRVDGARLGPLSGIDSGTSGTYYFDSFESRRTNYIGPMATGGFHFASYKIAPPYQGSQYSSQPDGTGGVDTYIENGSATSNYGTEVSLRIGESNNSTNKLHRSLIKFDLSSIPSNATITSATLSLWTTGDLSDNDRSIRVYRLKVPFVEGQATWNESASGVSWQSAGASGANDRESTDIGSVLVLANEADGTEKQISLDTTKLQEMVSGTFTNNGFIIIADTELNDRFNYKSSDASTSSQRPKLVIEYTTSTPTPGPSPTPTNTPSGPTATSTRTPTPGASNTPTAPPAFQSASFVYDGDGKRVKSTFNGSTTTYFVGVHYEVTGSTVTKYYYAGAQRIAMRSNGTLSYLLGDHLGSTSLTTDAAGNKVSELLYTAWGDVRYAWGNIPTKYQYTGQYSYEAEFGLYFYNARWYDPILSRFAQADSVLANPVWGWDRYAYVNNNPLAYTDPSGHQPCGDGEVVNCDGRTNTNTPPLELGSSSTPDDADLIDISLLKTDRGLQLYNLYRTMWEDQDGWWWKRYGSGGFTIWEFMSIFLGYEQSLYPNSQHFATSLSNKAPVWCLYMGCNSRSVEGALDFIASYSQSARGRLTCLGNGSCTIGTAFKAPPLPSSADSMSIVEAIHLSGPGYPGGNELYDVGNISLRPKIFKKMIALGMVNTVWGQKGQDRMIMLTFCQAQMASYAVHNGGAGAINMQTYNNFCGG